MRETSASEPSTRHRKAFRRHQNRSPTSTPGEAWRKPAYWPRGVRCIEGVTLIWALVRNLRTWPAMPREKAQGRQPEAESTDAPVRDGLLRSSDEARSEERRVGKECRSRWS